MKRISLYGTIEITGAGVSKKNVTGAEKIAAR